MLKHPPLSVVAFVVMVLGASLNLPAAKTYASPTILPTILATPLPLLSPLLTFPSPTLIPSIIPTPFHHPKTRLTKPVAPSSSYEALFVKYFGSAAPTMLRVAKCESGLNASALHYNTDGSVDSGLLGINSVHRNLVGGDISRLLDPETNLRVAAKIYAAQGLSPWVCARKLGLL